MAKQKYSRKLVFPAILLGLITFCALSYETILSGAGDFLAPRGMGKADVVILEGEGLIREKAVKIGIELLSSEKTKRMVIVLQQNSEDESVFALPKYSLLLTDSLQKLGLKKDQFVIIGVPTNHPITLTEARIVLADLSKRGVKSAILVAEGFHTRRSLWAYRQVALSLGIEIIPFPFFTKYRSENWWRSIGGARDFVSEFLKYIYYLIRGYIPLKSLLIT